MAIDLIDTELVLSVEQFKRLTSFHRFVFTRVLRLEKDPMVFRPLEASSSYIVVPLINGMFVFILNCDIQNLWLDN